MRIKPFLRLLMIIILGFGGIRSSLNAKSYPFSVNVERSVAIYQSAASGTKIVKVVSYSGNAKKAINKALQDAVFTASFTGIDGTGEMDPVPPILVDGLSVYEKNKSFFDKFFKNGEFLNYAHLANSEFPSGQNNISTPRGRKVTVYIVIEYRKLMELYNSMGLKTIVSTLKNQ